MPVVEVVAAIHDNMSLESAGGSSSEMLIDWGLQPIFRCDTRVDIQTGRRTSLVFWMIARAGV